MENGTEQVAAFFWSKLLLIVTSISISISLLEIEEYVKIYSYFVAAGSGTLAFILYVFRIRDKIKASLRRELEKNCPINEIKEKEANEN